MPKRFIIPAFRCRPVVCPISLHLVAYTLISWNDTHLTRSSSPDNLHPFTYWKKISWSLFFLDSYKAVSSPLALFPLFLVSLAFLVWYLYSFSSWSTVSRLIVSCCVDFFFFLALFFSLLSLERLIHHRSWLFSPLPFDWFCLLACHGWTFPFTFFLFFPGGLYF